MCGQSHPIISYVSELVEMLESGSSMADTVMKLSHADDHEFEEQWHSNGHSNGDVLVLDKTRGPDYGTVVKND
jgi:uncharacterized Ntn-hydrolase superfamily protein